MTPADEAAFIQLWNEGLETAAIAARLGITAATVQSRAHRLQQRGLIQPRPRGGAYPSRKALARQERAGVPAGVSRRTPRPAERGPSVRWNLRLCAGPRARIKVGANARGL